MTYSRSKLLFIHGSADLYGSDITLLQLVSRLNRNRFHSIVVVPYSGPLVAYLRRVGAEVIVYPNLPVLRRQHMSAKGLVRLTISALRAVPWLADFMCRQHIALVHSNTLAVLIAGLAAKFVGRPQVWHVHEIMTEPRGASSLLATISSMLSTVVVANSRATANHYCQTRFGASVPVRVVMNGTDEPRLHRDLGLSLRQRVGAGSKDTVFTLVGRVNRLKGHSVFIDAAERLAAAFEDVRFLIVGDSFFGQEWLSEAIDYRIESSDTLSTRMIRLPHIAEVSSVYAASDVIVVPSTLPESFGLVAAEAMAAGLPVVASRVGGLTDVVDDRRTGLLVDPGDPAALFSAMKQLKASPSQRGTMGREGRKRFENYFRVERYVAEFSRLYEEALENNTSCELQRLGIISERVC